MKKPKIYIYGTYHDQLIYNETKTHVLRFYDKNLEIKFVENELAMKQNPYMGDGRKEAIETLIEDYIHELKTCKNPNKYTIPLINKLENMLKPYIINSVLNEL